MYKLELYNKAKEAYYNGQEIMTDYEFDELEKELKLDNKSSIGAHHNPNYTIKHPYIMGSLSKVQIHEKNGVIDWDEYYSQVTPKYVSQHKDVIITPKFDGCSFEIYVVGNHIKSISTRGDGEYGSDISKQLKYHISDTDIDDINEQEYTLRGEVLIDKYIYTEKYLEQFVNPRSFVSGVLNSDFVSSNEYINKVKDLSIVIYDYRVYNGQIWVDKDWTELSNNKIAKLLPQKYELSNLSNTDVFSSIYEEFKKYRDEISNFALDGIVIKPISKLRIGTTLDKRPKDCVAIKFVPMLQETEVTDIVWNLSKTGELIPNIQVKPVEMDGKMVSKCSGFNYGYLIENKVSIGTKIIMSLAGDIIPFLYKITDSSKFSLDKIGNISIYSTYVDGCHLMTKLTEEDIKKNKFVNSASTLSIPNIGESTSISIFNYLSKSNGATDEFFGEAKKEQPSNILLVSPDEIYFGVGAGKSGSNAKKSFEKFIKDITLKDIIKSCNFRLCGDKAAIQIEKMLLGQEYSFEHLPYISYSWANDKNSAQFIEMSNILAYLGRQIQDFKTTYENTKVDDNVRVPVILTGEPNDYKSKAEFLQCHPEYRMTTSWKEVKYVFTNSFNSTTGKMKKAREKNIEIKLY